MRRLILMRHAKTEPRAPRGTDFDRHLTERGRADAALIGRLLAQASMAPDLAIVSTAARARETWDVVATAFPKTLVRFRPDLYDATPQELEAEVRLAAPESRALMVVGHQPSLHELALELASDGASPAADVERLAAAYPTAAAVVFAIDASGAHRLEAYFRASEHRASEALE